MVFCTLENEREYVGKRSEVLATRINFICKFFRSFVYDSGREAGGGIPGVFGGGVPPDCLNSDPNTSFSIPLSDLAVRVS